MVGIETSTTTTMNGVVLAYTSDNKGLTTLLNQQP